MGLIRCPDRTGRAAIPIFGVQWKPPVLDRDVARRVIVFLEDRRVLYDPYEVETPELCVKSVLEIRAFLTEVLGQGGIAAQLADSLRAMREACRTFLGSIPLGEDDEWAVDTHDVLFGGVTSWRFNQALGVLRNGFGTHIAQIAVKYGIDVEDSLAGILPLGDGNRA